MAWFVAAPIVLIAACIAYFNVQRRRIRIAAAQVPPDVGREILRRIDQAGADDGARVVLLRPLDGPPASGAMRQLIFEARLLAPPLAPVWNGRILSLYARNDEVDVESAPPRNEHASSFEPIRLPVPPPYPDVEWTPTSPAFLCDRVPAVRSLLAPFGLDAERLLPHLLAPGMAGFEPDTYELTLMGGEPELIQGPHDAKCPACAAPMRFLLSTGLVGDAIKGDAPVAYVYGCDAHPENVQSFVDIH